MNAQQLADLLVGVVQTQAAILTAVERSIGESSTSGVRQATQQALHTLLTHGNVRDPITMKNLPAKLLEGAIAPGSHAGRELEKTAIEEVSRLLDDSN